MKYQYNDPLELIIVGKSGFKLYDNIYITLSDYRDEIIKSVKKSTALASIDTPLFSIVYYYKQHVNKIV